jgi:hypothetical protein
MPAPAAARYLVPVCVQLSERGSSPEPRRVWSAKTRRIGPTLQIMTGWLALLLLVPSSPGRTVPSASWSSRGAPKPSAGSSPFRCLETPHRRRSARRNSNPHDQLARRRALGRTTGGQPTPRICVTLFKDPGWSRKVLESVPLHASGQQQTAINRTITRKLSVRLSFVERVTGIEPALSAWESVPSGPVTWPDLRG